MHDPGAAQRQPTLDLQARAGEETEFVQALDQNVAALQGLDHQNAGTRRRKFIESHKATVLTHAPRLWQKARHLKTE